MKAKEFSQIRHRLAKTQLQMAQLLGVSAKAIQSFEQGWRKIPIHTERQAFLLLSLKKSASMSKRPCWSIKRCPAEMRQNCPAWEFRAGQMCWIINGTICRGKVQKNWLKKMELCRRCEVFAPLLQAELRKRP